MDYYYHHTQNWDQNWDAFKKAEQKNVLLWHSNGGRSRKVISTLPSDEKVTKENLDNILSKFFRENEFYRFGATIYIPYNKKGIWIGKGGKTIKFLSSILKSRITLLERGNCEIMRLREKAPTGNNLKELFSEVIMTNLNLGVYKHSVYDSEDEYLVLFVSDTFYSYAYINKQDVSLEDASKKYFWSKILHKHVKTRETNIKH